MKRFTNTSEELRAWLLAELKARHVGPAQAITWKRLADEARRAGFRVGKDQRNLREEVQEMQVTSGEGALIVGSSAPPYGIFLATCAAEVEAYLATLQSRIAAHAEKIKNQRARAAEFYEQKEQIKLL